MPTPAGRDAAGFGVAAAPSISRMSGYLAPATRATTAAQSSISSHHEIGRAREGAVLGGSAPERRDSGMFRASRHVKPPTLPMSMAYSRPAARDSETPAARRRSPKLDRGGDEALIVPAHAHEAVDDGMSERARLDAGLARRRSGDCAHILPVMRCAPSPRLLRRCKKRAHRPVSLPRRFAAARRESRGRRISPKSPPAGA